MKPKLVAVGDKNKLKHYYSMINELYQYVNNLKYFFSITTIMVTMVVTSGFSPPEKTQPPKKKYNVLFIGCDDLNDVSIYNHPKVMTPNLDRLARRGIKFNRAYCQYPLCGPSRASILTGLRPDQTKVYNNKTDFRVNKPDVITLPQLFKQNGYYSARVGKVYHADETDDIGSNGMDDSLSWNKVVNPAGRDVFEEGKIKNLTPTRGLGASPSYLAADGNDGEQTDGITADVAIKLMQQNKDKPFFLAVGFFRPHHPFVAPNKYFAMYPFEKITLPIPKNNLNDLPDAAITTRPTNFGLNERQRKEAIRGYYASVSFMDAQVGKVLDALDRLKLSDNTIIVFWTDHGASFSEHGQWLKSSLFEIVDRVPLIISVPYGSKSKAIDQIVEMVDLYPTMADLCNLTVPVTQHLTAPSLKPLLINPNAAWDNTAYTQVKRDSIMGRSVRTDRWRYNEWDEGRSGTELYDEQNDKGELVNLAQKKEYEDIVHELSLLLRKSYESLKSN